MHFMYIGGDKVNEISVLLESESSLSFTLLHFSIYNPSVSLRIHTHVVKSLLQGKPIAKLSTS